MDKMQETNILIIVVGILESLAENAITIEEADKYFFSPRTAQLLSKNNCNSTIVDFIIECCELEDIASSLPDRLQSSIEELKNRAIAMLKGYEVSHESNWRDYDILQKILKK